MRITPLKIKIGQFLFPRYFIHFNPTKIPFVARFIQKYFMDGDDIIVMPRDVIMIDQEVEAPQTEILPTTVIEHFIRKACHITIINTCLCREALKCKTYPSSPGCIYLGEAARSVHPKLGRPATVEEALSHVRHCQELGLTPLIGRSKLDAITHDIGPSHKLMAICHCCPCCCVSRSMAYAHPIMGETFSRTPGIKVVVSERCQGCGTCAKKTLKQKICIYHAISMYNGRAVIDETKCRACGRCTSACPNHALEIQIEDEGFIKTTIERLERAVDVT